MKWMRAFGLCALCAADSPISQVLELLGKLQGTVIADGEVEQKQYEEFAEWCEDQAKQRQYEVKTGTAQSDDLRAAIEKASADMDALQAEFGDLSQKIATNEADKKVATDIREKEHAAFAKEENELVDTVDTLQRAQSVLARHLQSGSFVQMTDAMRELTGALNVIMDASVFSVEDKGALHAFLQQNENGVDAPDPVAYKSHSKGILETLADMQEKAEGMLAEARKTEMNAKHSFDLLALSLNDELKVQRAALSNARKQIGARGEVKGTAEGDLAATQSALHEDQKYLKDLGANCQQRAVDWEVSTKSRAEELKALAEAKRIISEMTGGASSRNYKGFIQLSDAPAPDATYASVAKELKRLGVRTKDGALTQLASRVKAMASLTADPFAKVKGLIEDMLARLIKEAAEEASHKAFCDKETAESEAKRDQHQATVEKLSTRIEKATAAVAKLRENIAELQGDLANIAKAQQNMDTMRAQEHEEFVKAEKDFSQGLDGVRLAVKVLRDYYSKQGSFVQQPAVGTHSAATDSASGIIGLLEVAESDFATSLSETRGAEDDAQNEYDSTSQDNRELAASKKAAVQGKQDEIGRLEQAVSDADADRSGVQDELDATLEYLEKLRPQCTTQPDSYAERKKRREDEIEGLKRALDILENETAGADSFLSLRKVRRHQ